MTDTTGDEDPRRQQAADSEPEAATPESAADHMIGSLSRSAAGIAGGVAAVLAAAVLGSAGSVVIARTLVNRSNSYEAGMAMIMGAGVVIVMALAVGAVLAVVGGLMAWAASGRVAAGVITALVVPTLVVALVIGDTSPPRPPGVADPWTYYQLESIDGATLPVEVDLSGAVGDLESVIVTGGSFRMRSDSPTFEIELHYRGSDQGRATIAGSGGYTSAVDPQHRLVFVYTFYPGSEPGSLESVEGGMDAIPAGTWPPFEGARRAQGIGAKAPRNPLVIILNGARFSFRKQR